MERTKWAIMREFGVLPTDERFQNLTVEQVAWISCQMEIDAKERKKALAEYDESYADEGYENWEERVAEEDDAYFG